MKKVSIIIPVFNAEENLENCIGSICSQTYKNLQIICINDGSTDSSIELLRKLASKDSRITIIDKPNEGVSIARNCGLRIAEGYYVQFVDSDDYIDENMTQLLVNAIEKSGAQLVACGYRSNTKKIQQSLRMRLYDKDMIVKNFVELYESTYLNPPWNKLYIRSHIEEEFPGDMRLGEDLYFNLSYIKRIEKLQIISNQPYVYSVGNPKSLTSQYDKEGLKSLVKKINMIIDFLPTTDFIRMKQSLSANFMLDFKRLFKSMIYSEIFTKKELNTKIGGVLESELWKQIMTDYTARTQQEKALLHSNINWFIETTQRNRKKELFRLNVNKYFNSIRKAKLCIKNRYQ